MLAQCLFVFGFGVTTVLLLSRESSAVSALVTQSAPASAEQKMGVPKQDATELVQIRYKVDGVTENFRVSVPVTKEQSADSKATAVADAINASAGEPPPTHPVEATNEGGGVVKVAGGPNVTEVEMSMSSNSNQPHRAMWTDSASTTEIGELQLAGTTSGIAIGSTATSTLSIAIGTTSHSFSLQAQPTIRALSQQIVDAFESSGVQASITTGSIIFELPSTATTMDVECDDRTLTFGMGILFL